MVPFDWFTTQIATVLDASIVTVATRLFIIHSSQWQRIFVPTSSLIDASVVLQNAMSRPNDPII